jgi:hypothetical protein
MLFSIKCYISCCYEAFLKHFPSLIREFLEHFSSIYKSNYIKVKFCVSVCVSVRYRTYLNIVGMGSKLLGVLRKTLQWSSNGQMFKKLRLKNWFFQWETEGKRENGRKTKTGTGAGTRTGEGRGTGAGHVFNSSHTGYPLLVGYNF